jgi:hypothetical protein
MPIRTDHDDGALPDAWLTYVLLSFTQFEQQLRVQARTTIGRFPRSLSRKPPFQFRPKPINRNWPSSV